MEKMEIKSNCVVYPDPSIRIPYKWSPPKDIPGSPPCRVCSQEDFESLDEKHQVAEYRKLSTEYRKFITGSINQYNKIRSNFEDLHQIIWLKLLSADILRKYHLGVARRLPLTMTSMEACGFLGTSFGAWLQFLKEDSLGKTLIPIKGTLIGMTSVWNTSDLCHVESLLDPLRQEVRVRPPVTERGFKTYLKRSIHNAFANFCRDTDRHYKEIPLPPGTSVIPCGAGCYSSVSHDDNDDPWELSITAAPVLDAEELLDLYRSIKNIDLDSSEGVRTLEYLIKQGVDEDGVEKNKVLLAFLSSGLDLDKSIKCTKSFWLS